MHSRLSKTAEKRTKKQLILSLLGIIVFLFVLIKFGIPILTNISLFLSSKNSGNDSSSSTNATVIAPPILTQSFTATNSATIIVSGTAQPNQTIQLFVNGNLVNTMPTDTSGQFTFQTVPLNQQQNAIQAKAKNGNTLSNFSDTWNVSYIQRAPSLSISSPHDGDTINSGSVTVSGKTDPDIKVTVNGFWAIVDNNGNYSYTLSVPNGDTHISVVATDAAGNTTSQQLTVHHSQ